MALVVSRVGVQVVAAGAALALVAACGPGVGPLFAGFDSSAFHGHTGPRNARGFDVVAADMDADGDHDLLINWHHLGTMELFEQQAGRFTLVNDPANDRSGLTDNPGVAMLFADQERMLELVLAAPPRGLSVWHDMDRRKGSWRFVWDGAVASTLELTTSLGLEDPVGVEADQVDRLSERVVRIRLPATRTNPGPGRPAVSSPRVFSVRTTQVSPRLNIRMTSADPVAPRVFVGRGLIAHDGGAVELWKPDPHGIAWVDVEGNERPELYITRGGLMGKLATPLAPKHDRYYRQGDLTDALYAMAPRGYVPPDHGRGRSVEWVDVDNDGSLELSIANEGTPNKLLRRRDDGGFADVAATYGVDLVGGEVQSWADFDRDGWQDLYYVGDGAVNVLRNTGGGRFEEIPGQVLGTLLPPSPPADESLFDFGALRLADHDCDGDLDLWLLMYGRGTRSNHLFERDGERFVDVTSEVGFDRVDGNIFALLCDVDNDGLEDVVSNGDLDGAQQKALLWRNAGGAGFSFAPLASGDEHVHFGAVIDADQDLRWDLVLIGRDRYLLRNIGGDPAAVEIELRGASGEPVGALVRLHHSSGRVTARRHGSVYNSAYSQVVGPMRFGMKGRPSAAKLTVLWPGTTEEREYPAPVPGRLTVITQ